jgi:hypothetical protein
VTALRANPHSTFLTAPTVHCPPRGVGTPRATSPTAICLKLVAPCLRRSAMIGSAAAIVATAQNPRPVVMSRCRNAPEIAPDTSPACHMFLDDIGLGPRPIEKLRLVRQRPARQRLVR